MRVIRAEALGMCFGVKDALAIADAVRDPAQVTIHGELVHNPGVTQRLRDAGFLQSREDARDGVARTPLVLITAHGVSHAERRRLDTRHAGTIDTTCPLVLRAHAAALELAAEGRHVLVIGQPDHVETRGLVGDLPSHDVVRGPADVRTYEHQRLGVVCQTTMPPDLVSEVFARIRRDNPRADVRLIDTVCQPTKLRQSALEDLVRQVQAVVVVGGRRSNNTRRLAARCRQHGTVAHHVERATDLRPEWFTDIDTVGLTAGTSTLDETVDDVHRALERLATDPPTTRDTR